MKINSGFTMVEILVVTTIIALLSVGGFVSYSQFGKQSRDTRRKADVEQIRAALEMYKSASANTSYPMSLSDLVPVYIKAIPLDPKNGEQFITYTPTCAGTPSICTTYTLTATLENGTYTADPLGSSVGVGGT